MTDKFDTDNLVENYEYWKQKISEQCTLEDLNLSIELVEDYPELKIDKFTYSPLFIYKQKAYACFSSYADSLDDAAKELSEFSGKIILMVVSKHTFKEGVYVRYAIIEETNEKSA